MCSTRRCTLRIQTSYASNVSLNADLLVHRFKNQKGVGLLGLLNGVRATRGDEEAVA